MKTQNIKALSFAVAALFWGGSAWAQQHITLKEAVQKAVLQNPEVQARWHAFQAGAHMVDVARGGLLPRVDLSAGTGRERLNQADSVGNDANYNRNTYSVGLTQLVYDGFGTTSEVRRLGKAKLTRYYELLDASENVALEAARAYYDVLRHRFLLALSEDTYVYHKATYEQLLMRAQSGVGRRVDVEQAASRLALAEVNLTTDQANLHDVTARYQRIVGEAPAQNMFAAEGLAGRLPGRADQALQQAFQTSPALLAAVENVEAAQYDLDVRKSAFHPKVELRASQNRTSNYLGSSEERRDNVVELVLNYNLFNGGSDQARTRQYAEQRHVALDQREKACRDLRQTVSIAYNDTQRLQEQLAFLESQVQMTERTREAYRDQFNIGQRTLLDVLDTENELFDARRAAVNADIDRSLAYLRTYAGMGQLLSTLELRRVDDGKDPLQDERAQVNPADLCPAEAPQLAERNREELNRRAMALLAATADSTVKGATPVSGDAGTPEARIQRRVNDWAAAWARQDYPAYAAFYASTFTPEGGVSRDDWAQLRELRVTRPSSISVTVKDLKVRVDGPDAATAEFIQGYSSNSYSDTTRKVLEWVRVGDKWQIQRETAVPVGR